MNKKERQKIIITIGIIPYGIIAIIVTILTIPIWLITKNSFENTHPFKLINDILDWLDDKEII